MEPWSHLSKRVDVDAGVPASAMAFVIAALLGSVMPAAQLLPFDLRIQPLTSPAPAGSAQPQLTVSRRGILLSWIEQTGSRAALKFSERQAGRWSAPRVVASGEDWFVNWADVPSVLRLSDGTLAAHWLQKSGGGPEAYDVRLAYSKDDGRTWSPSFTPHHDGTKTEHGFASLFELPAGGLGLIWLDGRAMTPGAHEGSAGAMRGAMSLRFASFDRNWKQGVEVPIDLRVCECCPTTAAVTSDGPIVAFRDRGEAELRDIQVTRFEAGRWTEPRPIHDDGWTIDGCPVNGPMLSAAGRTVAIVWFTMQDGQPRAFAAFSSDAGRTFGAPIRVDDGATLGRVDVQLLTDGSAVATWIESMPQRAEFRARRIAASGARSSAVTIATVSSSRASGYPRVTARGDELTFAWVAGTALQTGRGETGLHVMTAIARIPRP